MKNLYLKILGISRRFPNLFSIVIIFLFSIFMYGGSVLDFYESTLVSGFDGNFHYEIVKKYSENHFPDLYGWIDSWNAGSPWPIAYPPLFTYTFSGLNVLLDNPQLAFKLIIIISIYLVPILIFGISKNFIKDKYSQLFVGILGVFFMASSENMAGTLGVTVLSSLQNGLYPQLFAAVFFLLWFYFFLKYRSDQLFKFLISSIFLSFTLLTNLHVAEPAALIFIVCFAIDFINDKNRFRVLLNYFVYGLLVLGMAAFWIFPLIETRDFFLSRALAEVPLDASFFSITIWLIAGMITFIYSLQKKDASLQKITISAIIIFLVTVLPLKNWFPFLPLQPFRLFPFTYLLCLVVIPIAIKILLEKLKILEYYRLVLILFTFILIFFYPRIESINIYELTVKDKEVLEFLSKTNSRSVLEAYNSPDFTPTHTVISSYIPEISDSEVLWGVFRESAFNSPSIVPIRNSVSNFQESFGIACLLCFEYNGANQDYIISFAAQKLKNQIDRLRLFGVEYVVIHDKNIQIEFITNAQDLGIEQAFSNGDWRIFKIKDTSRAYKYSGKFVGVYTDIITGDRGMNDIDWHRLNEEWLRLSNYSYLFEKVSSESDLDKFETVFVNQNLDSSELEKLKIYSQDHKVVSLDEFKDNLREIVNVEYLPRDSIVISNYFDKLFITQTTFQDKFKPIEFSKSRNEFTVKNKDANLTDIMVAVSYFPWWKSKDGNVRLASPGLISMTTSSSEINIRFDNYNEIVRLGEILTAISIFLYIFLLLRLYLIKVRH